MLDTSAYVGFKRNESGVIRVILRAELITYGHHFERVAGLVCTIF